MTESSNPALSAWIRLLKVHNLILRRSRIQLSEYCTLAQFDILAQLSRETNGTTPAELSRRLLVTAGNLTGMIDRMESAGWVKRSRDEKDRRITRIHLTEAGKKLAKTVIPKHARDIRESFRSLNESETETLRELLETLIRGMENTEEQSDHVES